MSDSLKFDDGKIRMDLVPAEALEEIGKILTYGIKNGYSEDSWRKVDSKRYDAALMRHYVSWKKGEKFDEESKLRTLSHVLCNVVFLLVNEIEKDSKLDK